MTDEEHRRGMQDDIGEASARAGQTPTSQSLTPVGEQIQKNGEAGIAELSCWWKDRVLAEIDATVPKAIEYGSHDLVEMGRTLAYVMRRDGVTDEEAAELGIWFYQLGKMGRWTNAIRNQTRVSDDTLFDIGVYTKMAQRIRDVGAWPGVDLELKETK